MFFLSLFITNCTLLLQRLQTPSNKITGCGMFLNCDMKKAGSDPAGKVNVKCICATGQLNVIQSLFLVEY